MGRYLLANPINDIKRGIMMSLRILVLEDMPDTQKWLNESCQLAYPDASIKLASNLQDAGKLIEDFQPTLALIDLELPDGKGNDFIPKLLEKHPTCLCVVVTIYADENHLLPSLSAGAKGYILKDQSKQRIAEMLKQVMAGELPLSPAAAAMVLNQFSKPEEVIESPLTTRENDVLTLVAQGSSTPDVAEKLNISKYTVEDHLKQIYRKLDISSRAEAALAARKLNLV